MARSKKACIVFFDEVDAIGGARFDDGVGGDNEVQRTMLEIVNQLDGFDARGNIKVLMATNRYFIFFILLMWFQILFGDYTVLYSEDIIWNIGFLICEVLHENPTVYRLHMP